MKKGIIISLFTSAALMAGGDTLQSSQTITTPYTDFSLLSDVYGKGEARLRYGTIDTANKVGNANALTNRLLLGVGANILHINGLSAYVEAINVSGSGAYWDLTKSDKKDKGVYNVVADPSQTRITQAYIDYTMLNTNIRAGRQGINLDNQRFVGTVNWRQMPQTYDAITMSNTSINNLSLTAAYVWQVNTIFDADTVMKVSEQFETASVVLHAAYEVGSALTLTGYGYLLEDIHDTYGMAATGKISLAQALNLAYRAEYAQQSNPSFESKASKAIVDANYYNINTTLNMSGILLGAGYEVLGAGNVNKASSFTTPLATLHAHNGWVDKFLRTPKRGLTDITAMIGYKSESFGLAKIIYHDFSSDVKSINYGTEIDFIYKRKISGIKGLSMLVKAGRYTADAYSVDSNKYWAMLHYKF